jgi:hypothetical protein
VIVEPAWTAAVDIAVSCNNGEIARRRFDDVGVSIIVGVSTGQQTDLC